MWREKTQNSKIGNEKGKTTTNTKEIKGIIRDYFKKLDSNKVLDTYDHPKLNQEDINHLKRSFNEIQAAIVSQKRTV
jgi:predicted transcriptional regulator